MNLKLKHPARGRSDHQRDYSKALGVASKAIKKKRLHFDERWVIWNAKSAVSRGKNCCQKNSICNERQTVLKGTKLNEQTI